VLASISRLASRAWTPEQANLVMKLRAMVARFEDTRDLRLMGGYRGGDPELDKAVEIVPRLFEALKQSPRDSASADAFQEVARALQA
jgi:flagellum-specific ATP synthase